MMLMSAALQAFMAVVNQGTVHGAAETLNLTQTAVTQRLKVLEAKLNVTLFKRTRRGMVLTAEGEALLHYCKATQALEGETLAKITGVHQDATVEIAITGPSSVMRSRIIPACIPVMKAHPQLLVRFELNDKENQHFALKQGHCDFAILLPSQLSPEMQSKVLKPEQYVLVGPKAWQGRSLKNIIVEERIIDFEPSDQMTRQYLRHYGLETFARPERHFVNNADELVDLIAAGLGYSVLTWEFFELFSHKGIILLDPDEHYDSPLVLAWYQRPQAPGYFKDLLQAMH